MPRLSGPRRRLPYQPVLVVVAVTVAAILAACGGGRSAPASVGTVQPSAVPSVAGRSAMRAPAMPARSVTPDPSAAVEPSSRTVAEGTGRLLVVAGTGEVVGSGRPRRYLVEVEEGIGADPAAFAVAVERTLRDPRSWVGGGLALQRVSAGPVDFRVTLASPSTTDRYCRPLRTNGRFSCFMGGRSMVNSWRWHNGARDYGTDLAAYRSYVVNHEVGHALGHGHRSCSGEGDFAPVMMQQTKGVAGCRPNAWPLPGER